MRRPTSLLALLMLAFSSNEIRGQASVIQSPTDPSGIACTVGTSPAIIRGTDGAVCFCDAAPTPDSYTCAVGGGGGGAPTSATYITQTSNSTLTAEQFLSSLSSGILKNTTGTGVLSIAAAGTDFQAPDADLDDLADGSLSGAKIGAGILPGNLTGSGQAPDAAIHGANEADELVLVGEVDGAANANTVDRAITPVWTGIHEFDATTNFDALVDIDRTGVGYGIDASGVPVTGGSGFTGQSAVILLPRQGGLYGQNSDGSDAHLIGTWRNDAIAPNGTKMMVIGDPTNLQLMSFEINEALCPSWGQCGIDAKGHDWIDMKFIGNKAGSYNSIMGNALPWYSGTTLFDGYHVGVGSGRTQSNECEGLAGDLTRECYAPTRVRWEVGAEVAPTAFSRTTLVGWQSHGTEFGESTWLANTFYALSTATATNRCVDSGMTAATNATCGGGTPPTCTQQSTDQDHGWSTGNASVKAVFPAGITANYVVLDGKCQQTAATGQRWGARLFVYSSEDTERDFRFEIIGGTCVAEETDNGFPGADASYRPRLRGGEWNEIRFDTGALSSTCNGQTISPRISRAADSASGMNAACLGSGNPWDCCTGSAAGTCGGEITLYVDDVTFELLPTGDSDVGPHVSTDATAGGRSLAAGVHFVGPPAPEYRSKKGDYVSTVQVFSSGQAPMISGRWYGPRSAGYVDTSTTEVYGANLLHAYPFPVGARTTFDRIGIEVTTAQASTNARLGIYDLDETTGLCGDLILDAGEVSLASATEVTLTISQTLEHGWYCLAFVWNATTAAMTTVSSGENLYQLGGPSVGDQQAWGIFRRSFTYGTLPNPAGFVSGDVCTAASCEVPWIAVRKQ